MRWPWNRVSPASHQSASTSPPTNSSKSSAAGGWAEDVGDRVGHPGLGEEARYPRHHECLGSRAVDGQHDLRRYALDHPDDVLRAGMTGGGERPVLEPE